MNERPGRGPWARLVASAVVRDEGAAVAEAGRALVRDGAVDDLTVEEGSVTAIVSGCTASVGALPVPPRIWAATVRSARGNERLEEALAGRSQSVHLDHVMNEDWSEPLVPRSHELRRSCSCDARGGVCEHVAALGYAFAQGIDADPSLLLRWRGCFAAPVADEPGAAPRSSVDPADEAVWQAGLLPELAPPRPLPAAAVLKRLGPSPIELRGEDLADVLQRAYASFAASADA